MDVLKRWTKPVNSKLGIPHGETRVFLCMDQFGNQVIWIEQEVIGYGFQAASIVLTRRQAPFAESLCELMAKHGTPNVTARPLDWIRQDRPLPVSEEST